MVVYRFLRFVVRVDGFRVYFFIFFLGFEREGVGERGL